MEEISAPKLYSADEVEITPASDSYTQQLHSLSLSHSHNPNPIPNPNPTLYKSAECIRQRKSSLVHSADLPADLCRVGLGHICRIGCKIHNGT